MQARRTLLLSWALAAALPVGLVGGSGTARADVDDQLTAFEAEARRLATDLPTLVRPASASPRRLVDAQVVFSLGDYDTSSLMLFELAKAPGADQETATFYLGESLFHKGDKGAARAYFVQVANNAASKYYQRSLQRLVEIAIAQRDTTDVEKYLAALDRGSGGTYTRGKWAYAQGKLDEALTYFRDVPKASEHELQAQYYVGTTLVAKRDIAGATELFTALVDRKPRSTGDRRVIELSYLALGRLHYERDQMGKSIDAYLRVDRHSDVFADALYEVAWVYVKGKQYDKALRALELLAQSDPGSNKTATLRILEGNLRVRKAQMIRAAQVQGTFSVDSKEDPAIEYEKATRVFTETHDLYEPAYRALAQMLDTHANPEQYLAQIAGRSSGVFMISPPLPEAAVQYLRDEPEVQRAIAIENDLNEIDAHITDAEATIARLDAVIAAGDRMTVYPALAARRARIGAIQDELIKIRNDLADRAGDTGGPTATRRRLAEQYAAMPSPEQTFANGVTDARSQYDTIDQTTGEIVAAIDSAQAMAVALRKYALDAGREGVAPLAPGVKSSIDTTLAAAAGEAIAIDRELKDIQRELTLGKDLAGVGDQNVARARESRRQLRAAQDAEQRAQGRASAQADRAMRLAEQLDQLERQIDGIVDQGLAASKQTISDARRDAMAYRRELVEHQADSRAEGGAAVAASLKDVKAKLYDIVIRADVGNVDVAWSQKEDTDDDLKRLMLSRQRELKQLKDEFRGIIDAVTPRTPATPAPATPPASPPSGSPDQGGASRVKPGGDAPAAAPTPKVQPETKQPETKPATKKPATPATKTPATKTPATKPAGGTQ